MQKQKTAKQRVAARNKSRANTDRKAKERVIDAVFADMKRKGTPDGPRQPLLELRQSLKGKKISDSGAAALGRKKKKAPAAKKKAPVKARPARKKY